MKYVGAHVNAAGGLFNAAVNSKNIGAKAFAFFTKNQRQWKARPLSDEEITLFKNAVEENGFSASYILPHSSYLINLGNADKEKRDRSLEAFSDELTRASLLGLKYLNFHPGSHLKEISEEECLDLISASMNSAFKEKATGNITAVIETTAGQGTNVGYKFEHIARIIGNAEEKTRTGVCIDTCHIFAAGYDISSTGGFEKTMENFDKIIGIKYLKGIHLNGAKKECGSKVDRHTSLNEGFLGKECFSYIMNSPLFENIPIILETPDPTLWADEIKMLYSLIR